MNEQELFETLTSIQARINNLEQVIQEGQNGVFLDYPRQRPNISVTPSLEHLETMSYNLLGQLARMEHRMDQYFRGTRDDFQRMKAALDDESPPVESIIKHADEAVADKERADRATLNE